jgi:membrane protein implicated in regulation of membrane protease activity
MPCLSITVAQVLGAAMFMINIGGAAGAVGGTWRHEMAWKLMSFHGMVGFWKWRDKKN